MIANFLQFFLSFLNHELQIVVLELEKIND